MMNFTQDLPIRLRFTQCRISSKFPMLVFCIFDMPEDLNLRFAFNRNFPDHFRLKFYSISLQNQEGKIEIAIQNKTSFPAQGKRKKRNDIFQITKTNWVN